MFLLFPTLLSTGYEQANFYSGIDKTLIFSDRIVNKWYVGQNTYTISLLLYIVF